MSEALTNGAQAISQQALQLPADEIVETKYGPYRVDRRTVMSDPRPAVLLNVEQVKALTDEQLLWYAGMVKQPSSFDLFRDRLIKTGSNFDTVRIGRDRRNLFQFLHLSGITRPYITAKDIEFTIFPRKEALAIPFTFMFAWISLWANSRLNKYYFPEIGLTFKRKFPRFIKRFLFSSTVALVFFPVFVPLFTELEIDYLKSFDFTKPEYRVAYNRLVYQFRDKNRNQSIDKFEFDKEAKEPKFDNMRLAIDEMTIRKEYNKMMKQIESLEKKKKRVGDNYDKTQNLNTNISQQGLESQAVSESTKPLTMSSQTAPDETHNKQTIEQKIITGDESIVFFQQEPSENNPISIQQISNTDSNLSNIKIHIKPESISTDLPQIEKEQLADRQK